MSDSIDSKLLAQNQWSKQLSAEFVLQVQKTVDASCHGRHRWLKRSLGFKDCVREEIWLIESGMWPFSFRGPILVPHQVPASHLGALALLPAQPGLVNCLSCW